MRYTGHETRGYNVPEDEQPISYVDAELTARRCVTTMRPLGWHHTRVLLALIREQDEAIEALILERDGEALGEGEVVGHGV